MRQDGKNAYDGRNRKPLKGVIGMSIEERYEEARKKHWGTYCAVWETCEKDGMCNSACPEGGVDYGKTPTAPTAGDNKIPLKW